MGALDLADVDALLDEGPEVLLPEILSDDGHNGHVGEVTGRQAEVGGGTADYPVGVAERRLDAVERDRADGQQTDGSLGHAWHLA